MKTETSILLPSAIIDLFLKDKETADAARALQDDWRFARVKIRVHEGDVETAIRSYTQSGSPDLVFLETDSTDEAFVTRLNELASHCNEGTSAVVIGPVNDVNLYRRLTAMGVSDYLVRPVPQDILGDVIANGLIEKLGTGGSRLIAMIGAKGGTGVSSLSQILARASSEKFEQKTLLLDAAGAWSTLGVGLGFEPLGSTAEALKAVLAKDADSLKRMQYQVNERFFVLATGTESLLETPAQIAQFEDVLNTVMANFPVVIADLSGAIPSVKKTVLTRAHQISVVSTPTLPSLRSARALIQEIKKLHGGKAENIDLIVNMEGMAPGKEVSRADIKAALDLDPSITISFDAKQFIGAESEGKLSTDKSVASLVDKVMPLLRALQKKDVATDTQGGDKLISSLLGRIKKK